MTAPTSEPARAEPVGGVRVEIDIGKGYFVRDNGPPFGWCLHDEDGYRLAVFTDAWCATTFADALAPAFDAGLAEVERLVKTLSASINVFWTEPQVGSRRDCMAAEQALLSAFAAQAAIIAALRADNDRLQADAAGRGEGVESLGLQKAEDIADHWHQRFLTLRSEASVGNLTRRRNLTERAEGAKQVLDEIKAERARIAAAPAPATDGMGGQSDG